MTATGRCVDPACTDGPLDTEGNPAPRWARTGLLCPRCTAQLDLRLAELPGRHAQVRASLAGGSSSRSSETRPTKGNPPVPLDLDALDLADRITDVVAAWAANLCDDDHLRGPDRRDVYSLAPWLRAQLDRITPRPWVADLAHEVRDLSRRADQLTGMTPVFHRLPVPCPACGEPELGRWDGAEQVGCAACGDSWPEATYDRLVLVLANDSGTSVTALEAARIAAVPPATFRQWVSRGLVRRLGTVDGLARYSTADLDRVRQDGAA